METSLHRSLKHHYALNSDSTEVVVDSFRIDAIDAEGILVEVQHASLGSIRNKIIELRKVHRIRVIKPLIRLKWIENYDTPTSEKPNSRRRSPKKCCHRDLFGELIHFTSAFPHPNLTLEVPLVDIVERRVPKKNRRWKRKQYRVLDQILVEVGPTRSFQSAMDLWDLLECHHIPHPFDTRQLSQAIERPRWYAQQVAYVLQKCGAIDQVGKTGNSKLYSVLAATAGAPKVIKRRKRKAS